MKSSKRQHLKNHTVRHKVPEFIISFYCTIYLALMKLSHKRREKVMDGKNPILQRAQQKKLDFILLTFGMLKVTAKQAVKMSRTF